MSARGISGGSVRATLYSATITTAITTQAFSGPTGLVNAKYITLYGRFVYGSGGTSADAWIQSSIDGGNNWFDIANFHFLVASASKMHAVVWDPATPLTPGIAPGSGALAANTVLSGVIGDRFRTLVTTVGTYAGGTILAIDMVAKG